MRYVITRHAQAVANDREEYPRFDEPLTALGRRQAAALGSRLAGRTFDVLIHSGSVRTAQTAEAIIPLINVADVRVDSRVQEGEVGDWEGEQASMRSEVARQSRVSLWEVRPPGGESYLDIDARLQPLLADIRSGAFGDTVLIVGHGRLNGLAIRALLGTPWEDFDQRRMHHTGVTELEVDLDQVQLIAVDDIEHLAPTDVTR